MELPSVPTDELPDIPESSEKRAGLVTPRIIQFSFFFYCEHNAELF